MFTLIAFGLAAVLAWYADWANKKERPTYDQTPNDPRLWILLLHARQDLKMISFLLYGVIVMLGVIADRIH